MAALEELRRKSPWLDLDLTKGQAVPASAPPPESEPTGPPEIPPSQIAPVLAPGPIPLAIPPEAIQPIIPPGAVAAAPEIPPGAVTPTPFGPPEAFGPPKPPKPTEETGLTAGNLPLPLPVLDQQVLDAILAMSGTGKATSATTPSKAKKEAEEPGGGATRKGAADVLSGLGLGGIGGIVGAASGVGAAIAAINFVSQKLTQGVQSMGQMATAAAGLDAGGFTRGVSQLVSQVPLFGGAVSGMIDATLGVSDAIGRTAQRFAQYNPEIALELANQEIRNIFRDIERSQRTGADLIQGIRAREDFNVRVEELLIKYLPTITKLLETGLPLLGTMIDVTLAGFRGIAEAIAAIAALIPGGAGTAARIMTFLARIARNTERPESSESDEFYRAMFGAPGGSPVPQAGLPAPAPGGPRFGGV